MKKRQDLPLPAPAEGEVGRDPNSRRQTVTSGAGKAFGIATLLSRMNEGCEVTSVGTAPAPTSPGTTPTTSPAQGPISPALTLPPSVMSTNVFVGPVYAPDASTLAVAMNQVLAAKNGGCNMITVIFDAATIPYDGFNSVDQLLAYGQALGMKLRVSFQISPQQTTFGATFPNNTIPNLPANALKSVDYLGRVDIGLATVIELSCYDPVALKWMSDLVALWADHILAQEYASAVIILGITKSYTRELEQVSYSYTTTPPKAIITGYDSAALTAFKTQMAAKYGTIGTLNAAWGTGYTQFSQITFPTPPTPNNVSSVFGGQRGIDFYTNREKGLRNVADTLHGILKAKNPNWLLLTDCGSMTDSQTPLRGTANPLAAFGQVEGRKINAYLYSEHAYWLDTAAAGLGTNGFWANELDFSAGTEGAPASAIPDQYNKLYKSIQQGATLITIANLYESDNDKLDQLLHYSAPGKPKIADLIAAGPQRPTRSQTITISRVNQVHTDNGQAHAQWQAAMAGGAASVNIQFEEPA